MLRELKEAYLVFPSGNKSINVNIKLTDLTLSISHSENTPEQENINDFENYSDEDHKNQYSEKESVFSKYLFKFNAYLNIDQSLCSLLRNK